MLGLKLDRWAGGWADDPPSSHLDSNPRWRGQWKPLLQSPATVPSQDVARYPDHNLPAAGHRRLLTSSASKSSIQRFVITDLLLVESTYYRFHI